MKLVLKSISQDINVEDPTISASYLVFQADVVPEGVPGVFRVPVSEEAVGELADWVAAIHGSPQEPGEAGPDEPEEEEEPEQEELPEDHQDEHPDVAMGATEFRAPRGPAPRPTYPLQRQVRPRPQPQGGADEDGVPQL